MTMLKFWVVCLCLTLIQPVYAEEADHEGTAIELSAEEQRAAGIVIGTVEPRALNETLRIPGEVVINAYRSVLVTPRITAQVVARHAKLGAEVEVGQPLVALSSVEMAEAQGTLIVANREWQRVKTLGRQAVSEQRYTEAQVAQQHALAKVLAYGMTMAQAEALMQSGDASKGDRYLRLARPTGGHGATGRFYCWRIDRAWSGTHQYQRRVGDVGGSTYGADHVIQNRYWRQCAGHPQWYQLVSRHGHSTPSPPR